MENSTKLKSFFGKINSLINKLPFSKLLAKVPFLQRVAKFANYAFLVLILLIVIVMCSTASGGNSLEGTWIHYYDGSDSKAFYDDEENDFAISTYIFYNDGTYLFEWPSRTSTVNYKFISNGGVAYYVVNYGQQSGTYTFDGTTLSIEPDRGKSAEYNVEVLKQGRKLRIGSYVYIKH